MLQRFPRLFSLTLTLIFFGLIWLYVREFPVFSNTIGVLKLLVGAGITGLLLALSLLVGFRRRFSPVSQHLPEVMFILVVSMLFMPLFASLLNRHFGEKGFASFVFVAEKPFVASGYGILKGEKVKTSGYLLTVQEDENYLMFKYKSQAFFPNTKPGESVLLPISKGLFGIRVVTLK